MPIRLNSSEAGSSFECTDNGDPVACAGPRWELADPAPGRHVIRARTVDRAGNASAWSDPVEFFVPVDLARSQGSSARGRRCATPATFDGDALRATRRGARLVVPRTEVGELRLLAADRSRARQGAACASAGATGTSSTSRVRGATMQQLIVLDRYSGVRRGKVVIETLSRKPVVLDAVVARPNRFPRRRLRRRARWPTTPSR